jgi:hypothetical protein
MDLVPEVIALTRLQPQRLAERPTSEASKCAGSEPEASSRNTRRADPDSDDGGCTGVLKHRRGDQ